MFELLKKPIRIPGAAGAVDTSRGVIRHARLHPVGTQGVSRPWIPANSRNGHANHLGNTYHLHIRPGLDIINAAGGLHQFINWRTPS